VSPGKHRLAVYLPTNLRYDPGIGGTEIKVEPGQSLVGVQIKLDPLAEVRVQILDTAGSALEGITAGATWSKTGDGSWTEGTRSDKDGNEVVYVYPGQAQYIRGFDMNNKLVSEGFEKVEAQPAEARRDEPGVAVRQAHHRQRVRRLIVAHEAPRPRHAELLGDGGQLEVGDRLVAGLARELLPLLVAGRRGERPRGDGRARARARELGDIADRVAAELPGPGDHGQLDAATARELRRRLRLGDLGDALVDPGDRRRRYSVWLLGFRTRQRRLYKAA
jgi:hypothetical protein